MKIFSRIGLIIGSLLLPLHNANAILNIELTNWSNNMIPIAIVPFAGQDKNSDSPDNIATVVNNDLKSSGRFKLIDKNQFNQFPNSAQNADFTYWRSQGADNLVVGNLQPVGDGNYKVSFSLLNSFASDAKNRVLLAQEFTIPSTQLRKGAHHISDLIYQRLLNIKGIFSTHIAYVLVDRTVPRHPKYTLQVADVDGYNPRPLLSSPQPIMSPAWSPDGHQIAYVSFENQKPQIFVQNIGTGSRRAVTNYSGINGAPAWSPDGNRLAVVLSRSGHPKINIIDLGSGSIKQVTSGPSIDTEPDWSPDGQSIIFTSDRGGNAQIYQLAVATGQIKRVTYDGNYNVRGAFAPDGKSIIMLHRDSAGGFDIASQDLQNGVMTLLTRAGLNDSPRLAPNGKMVLYTNMSGRKVQLGIVSTDGNVKLRLPAPEGDVQSPAWSPFAG